MLDRLILFCKSDFCSVSRVVFKGGILGGAHQFWGNPCLNSMTVLLTVLFDMQYFPQLLLKQLN